jgi:SAM-dependent methyltransferase
MVRRIMKSIKRLAAGLARRLGLLAAATDAFLFLKTKPWKEVGRRAKTVDGIALPSASLRFSAAGTADEEWFLQSGRAGAEVLREVFEELPRDTEPARILDFGCGCGRVLRHVARWQDVTPFGIDWNPRAVRWCRNNLPRASVFRGGLGPPLPEVVADLDLVYAFSVFTHLPEDLQVAWLAELSSRLCERGRLVLSTMGDAFADQLTDAERTSYDQGRLVLREPSVAGTNVCAAYHPPGSLERLLPADLEVVRHVPEGARGNPPQDLVVVRKLSR